MSRLRGFSAALVVAFLVLLNCSAQSRTEQFDILITGGDIVTVDGSRRILVGGSIAIRGDRIARVAPAGQLRGRAKKTVDARGKIILPGLVNAHAHAPMSLFRGVADDLALMEWLQRVLFPAEARNVDADFVYWGTLLSAWEMLATGTTTFADMYYFESDIARAVEKAGIRAVLGETIIDFPAPDNKTVAAALAYTEEFLKKWKGHALVTPAVAPHAPFTCSKETLLQSKQLADRYAAPVIIHVAETEDEVRQVLEKTGERPLAYLEKIGFLDDRVVINHGVWLNPAEIAILARRRVGVSHNPESNMKLASGAAPVAELLAAGVDVGLGTDGAASNNNQDMFEAMGAMALLSKLVRKDPTAANAEQVLYAATMGGARALNMADQIGSIEEGKKADLVLVDAKRPAALPLFNPVSQLVYSIRGGDVSSVLVNGRVVYENGRLTLVSIDEIRAKANEYRDKIRKSLATIR